MSSIKLQDVINLQKKQTLRYNQLREDIYSKMIDKISNLAKNGQLKMIFTVPVYIFGHPPYNVADITAYLYNKINHEGFCSIILDKNKIFISWDINDINRTKIKNKKEQKKFIDLKPLLNFK